MQHRVVLAGNPNCGKTALFNALTGSRQRVGNWPGVTVERKQGEMSLRLTHESTGQSKKSKIEVIDLPGTYSLTSLDKTLSLDQKIANDCLLSDDIHCVINVVDGANLERNLYLTTQLLELGVPVIVAVNMMDIVKQRGLQLDLSTMSQQLGCPTVALVANKKRGITDLQRALQQQLSITTADTAPTLPQAVTSLLPQAIKDAQAHLLNELRPPQIMLQTSQAALALRLLEGDLYARAQISLPQQIIVQQQVQMVQQTCDEEPDLLIADARYRFINQLTKTACRQSKTKKGYITQKIDSIVLNRYLGIPIFLLVMYLMFVCAINIGGAFQDFFDISSTAILIDAPAHLLQAWHWPVWLIALLTHGVGKGINTTITFMPVIAGMFLCLALLEDSGYMARAAFIMDRAMRALGLPGRSFVPMIVGFGCNVPAVMGARGIGNRRDRILTIMMSPFMSCGARLAIFAVFVSTFFPHHGQNIVFLLYLLGIVVAVLTGLLLRRTVLPGKPSPLIMELPPYHLPQWTSVWRQTWQRLSGFLLRAGKYIVPVCVLIGVLNSVSPQGKLLVGEANHHSILSQVGRVMTPAFSPLGITQDNWPATVGLITGVLAKEVVIGSLNTLYSQQAGLPPLAANPQANATDIAFQGVLAALQSIPDNLSGLSQAFSNPVAASEAPHDISNNALRQMHILFISQAAVLAYLIFILLYFPCVSTMAVIRRELGHAWAWLSVFWSTAVAYAVAVSYFQLNNLIHHPLITLLCLLGILLCCCLIAAAADFLRSNSRGRATISLLPTTRSP